MPPDGSPCAICGAPTNADECARIPYNDWKERINRHRVKADLEPLVPFDFLESRDTSILGLLAMQLRFGKPQSIVDSIGLLSSANFYDLIVDFEKIAAVAARPQDYRSALTSIYEEAERDHKHAVRLHANPAYKALIKQAVKLEKAYDAPPPLTPLPSQVPGETAWHLPKGKYSNCSGFYEFMKKFLDQGAPDEWQGLESLDFTFAAGECLLQRRMEGAQAPESRWRLRVDAYVWIWNVVKRELPEPLDRFMFIIDFWRERIGDFFTPSTDDPYAHLRPFSITYTMPDYDRTDSDGVWDGHFRPQQYISRNEVGLPFERTRMLDPIIYPE